MNDNLRLIGGYLFLTFLLGKIGVINSPVFASAAENASADVAARYSHTLGTYQNEDADNDYHTEESERNNNPERSCSSSVV